MWSKQICQKYEHGIAHKVCFLPSRHRLVYSEFQASNVYQLAELYRELKNPSSRASWRFNSTFFLDICTLGHHCPLLYNVYLDLFLLTTNTMHTNAVARTSIKLILYVLIPQESTWILLSLASICFGNKSPLVYVPKKLEFEKDIQTKFFQHQLVIRYGRTTIINWLQALNRSTYI